MFPAIQNALEKDSIRLSNDQTLLLLALEPAALF